MYEPLKHILGNIVIASIAAATIQATALAQTTEPIRLDPITVHVYKEKDDAQRLPVSVTGISESVLRGAGVLKISDAGILAPNTFFSEFTARKLSNARFRGIGSSPLNPGITTYIDGVPQFNTNSSNIEFLDIEQVEFVRGPQSALYGRNTLGGLINITTERPSLNKWTGGVTALLGNRSEWDARAGISGPISDKVGLRVTAGHAARDGFTINDVTGHDLDYRRTSYGKAQLWWTPTSKWETRLIVTGQRDQDGDYALNDLAALRQKSFHSSRDFEGVVERDIVAPTFQIRWEGSRFSFGSTSGLVNWKTRDVTDLDYTARPLITRNNREKDIQFTQEARFASAPGAPAKLGERVRLRWQTGVFFFTQNYDQDAINNFAPFLLSPQLGFPVAQHSPRSALDDKGVGVYGQVTATFGENFDLTFGARVDHENKEADLRTFFDPAISPENRVIAEKGFSNVSPQVAASYRFAGNYRVYASAGRGYKAGGFNPASPVGSEAYGEEKTWHYESGVEALLAGGKLSANASLFYIDWSGLQLNVPNPAVPAQFFIRNIGKATSKGFEAEINARPHANIDLFATFGLTHARFADNTFSGGGDVSGNKLPSAPDHTFTVGAQLSKDLNKNLLLYGRGEVWFNGGFEYDDANRQRQEAYSLANFRAGLRWRYAFVEAWTRNAFDCRWQNHFQTGECRFDCFDPVVDLSPAYERVARSTRMLDLVGQLYGESACLFKDKLIFKPPGAEGYRLHQDYIAWDSFPVSFLTAIVAIDACDRENGATEVFRGYHRRGYMSPKDGMYHHLPDESVDESAGVVLTLAPGDVAVFSGYTPHRSSPNRSGRTRRLLYLSYNAFSDGGEQHDSHYAEFADWLQDRYAEYGKTMTYFR